MPIKIIYLLGLGHSGTTLLGRLLNAHSKVIATGGTKNIPLFVRGRKSCACGAKSPDQCVMWSTVHSCLERKGTSLSELQFGYDNQKNLNHESLRLYFESVLEASGASVIVDTSRRRTYFTELEQVSGVELIPVHIFKDPRAQYSSAKRKGGRLIPSLWSYNLRARRIHGLEVKGQEIIHIPYEYLCQNPRVALSRVMEAAGLSLEEDQVTNFGEKELHVLGGNRQRTDKSSVLRLDESWRKRLTPFEQKMVLWLGGRAHQKNLKASGH